MEIDSHMQLLVIVGNIINRFVSITTKTGYTSGKLHFYLFILHNLYKENKLANTQDNPSLIRHVNFLNKLIS